MGKISAKLNKSAKEKGYKYLNSVANILSNNIIESNINSWVTMDNGGGFIHIKKTKRGDMHCRFTDSTDPGNCHQSIDVIVNDQNQLHAMYTFNRGALHNTEEPSAYIFGENGDVTTAGYYLNGIGFTKQEFNKVSNLIKASKGSQNSISRRRRNIFDK